MRGLFLLAIVLVAFGAARWAMQRPIVHSAGTLVSTQPRQTSPSDDAPVTFEQVEVNHVSDPARSWVLETELPGNQWEYRRLQKADMPNAVFELSNT